MDTLAGQVYGFAATIAAGLSLGLLFDLYRLWRRATGPRRAVTALSDILFWVIATPLTYFYLLVGNWAELRYYVILGLLLGLFLYFSVFSILVINLISTLWYFIATVIGGLLQGLWLLVSLPWEGAVRWRTSMRWRPSKHRIIRIGGPGKPQPRWSGGKQRFWPLVSLFRK